MSGYDHQIGKISLYIDSGSLPAALRLRARAEEIAWHRLPALIETIFDALAPAGTHIHIARLELGLEDIAAERLELDLPAALERALRAALAEAIDSAIRRPGDDARALPAPAAMLDEFYHYLRNGALPSRGTDRPYNAAAILTRLIDLEPAALAGLLRRRAGEPHVIERLALQAGEAHLRALLDVLSPADAALILAYLGDFRRCHTDAAAVRLAEPELGHALWIVTLKYLLHEAGTQFNRRRYLATLLTGVAAAEGLGYATLLALMHTVASRTRSHRPLAGSLLGTLDELLDELGGVLPRQLPAAADGNGDDGLLGEEPLGGQPLSGQPLGEGSLSEESPSEELLTQLRSAAVHPVAMDLLVQPMTAPVFGAIVGALQPRHAPLILAYLDELALLHRERPAPRLDAGNFAHQARLIALRYLLLEGGSQFNRLSWLRRLLQGLAVRAGVGYAALLATFSAALGPLRARQPLSSSLPEGLAALAAELHPGRPGAGEPAVMLAKLRGLGADQRALNAGMAACTPAQFGAMLAHAIPAHADEVAADLERLARLIAGWRQAPAALHQVQLPPLAMRAVLDGAGPPFERRAWWRRLLLGLPEQAGLPASSLAAAIAAQAQRPGAADAALGELLRDIFGVTPAPPQAPAPPLHAEAAMALAEDYLRSGRPAHGGAQLITLAAANPRGLAALLRRLLAAASGNTQALTERLLSFLLPEEVVAILLPEQQGQAVQWARALAAQPGASPACAWHQVLDAAWRDMPPAAIAPPFTQPARAAPLAAPINAGASRPAQAPVRLLAWLSGTSADTLDADAQGQLAQLFSAGGDALQTALRAGLASPSARARWIDTLPEELLARMLHSLAPARAHFLLDLKDLLAAAWRRSGIPAIHGRPSRLLWDAIWALLAKPAEATQQAPQRQAAAALLQQLPAAPGQALRILAHARHLASQGGYIHLSAVLQTPPAAPPVHSQPPRQPAAAQEGDILYVDGAGLVLVHVFLPMLFAKLELLSKDDSGRVAIHGSADASRAVHLLQYLVDGRCDAAEPELALNKLLCGLALDTPVAAAIEPSDEERAICDQLLAAVIGNWSSIGNTSIAGLRETFLQRAGRLQYRDGKWTLTVPRKTVDVLVDQIAWGYAVILHPWMEKELSVVW